MPITLESIQSISKTHALSFLLENTNSLLDIGCNVGENLFYARELGVEYLKGIEINQNAVDIAKKKATRYENIDIFQGSADKIPVENNFADAIICLEVLEHIPSELRQAVIKEMVRTLKPGGQLILSVPHKGLFSFLDPANLRISFSGCFKILSRLVGGAGREAGFENQKHGIVWHKHFTMKELNNLFDENFVVTKHIWRGALIAPIANILEFPFYRLNKTNHFLYKVIRKIHHIDAAINYGPFLGYNVVIAYKKRTDMVGEKEKKDVKTK